MITNMYVVNICLTRLLAHHTHMCIPACNYLYYRWRKEINSWTQQHFALVIAAIATWISFMTSLSVLDCNRIYIDDVVRVSATIR
jgi:hypothetical protein